MNLIDSFVYLDLKHSFIKLSCQQLGGDFFRRNMKAYSNRNFAGLVLWGYINSCTPNEEDCILKQNSHFLILHVLQQRGFACTSKREGKICFVYKMTSIHSERTNLYFELGNPIYTWRSWNNFLLITLSKEVSLFPFRYREREDSYERREATCRKFHFKLVSLYQLFINFVKKE